MPHPLLNGAFFYNGHLQGPVTLTPITEHLAVELSPAVLHIMFCFEHHTFRMKSETNSATAAASINLMLVNS